MLFTYEIKIPITQKKSSCPVTFGLIGEVILVASIAFSLIKISSFYVGNWGDWLAGPAILIAAALIPTRLRKIPIINIGLNVKHLRMSLYLNLIAYLIIFPLTLIGILILRRFELPAPLIPEIPQGLWINWIFYQVMYVAVAEEIFFRGYLQSTIQRLLTLNIDHPRQQTYFTIVISAGIFALAHVVLTGNFLSALTFFPGIMMGWLFHRTKSVLSPIIFHAGTNIFYAIITSWLY